MVNRSIRLLETGGRARRLVGVLLGATLLALPGAVPAAAQGAFKNVGDERVVGKNRTGEECRLRLVGSRPDLGNFQRYALYCEGWTQPSGEIRSILVPKGYAVEKLLTDSVFQKDFETRVAGCGPIEPTTLASGAPAALRDSTSVILGADANETRVRATDLAQYRVVAFATHGLLPGELKCKSEPALALTPPATSSATDDGLLDANEVAQLKLDADWVVLSACNTAGPGGALGGESLSGLARAFFYAGARALLVSHWAVASRATVVLTTTTFDAQARRDPALGRAEALRRAQLVLAADKGTSHPFYWAPFVLVGDGGAPAPP